MLTLPKRRPTRGSSTGTCTHLLAAVIRSPSADRRQIFDWDLEYTEEGPSCSLVGYMEVEPPSMQCRGRV